MFFSLSLLLLHHHHLLLRFSSFPILDCKNVTTDISVDKTNAYFSTKRCMLWALIRSASVTCILRVPTACDFFFFFFFEKENQTSTSSFAKERFVWFGWGFTAQSTHYGHVEPISLPTCNHMFSRQTYYSKRLTSTCAHSFARNRQLPVLNQRTGKNDKKIHYKSPRKDVAGIEPATFGSPVGRAPDWASEAIFVNEYITKTCLYNFNPHKPHFYIVNLGFTGVYIIFLISAKKT